MSWQWLAHPVAQGATLALVHFLWQGAALAVLAGMLLRRMPQASPSARYAVCLATLVFMACCPWATYWTLQVGGESSDPERAVVAAQVDAANVASLFDAPSADSTFERHAAVLNALQPFVLTGYLAGVLVLSIRFGCGYLGTLWLRSDLRELSPEWSERVRQLASRIGVRGTTRVAVSLRTTEAVAVGWLRPVVLLPLGWLTALPPDALEAVIAHELAHLRRFDLWTSLLQRAIETLLFYHPAVWWLSRRTTLEREMCCDALAVKATGQRLSYARTLETLGSRAAGDGPLLLATTFLGESDMNLLARVRQVLGLRPQRETGRAWPAGLAALGLAVALFTIAALPARQTALAQEEREEKAERREDQRRSPEAERGERRSPEADAPRRESSERRREGDDRRRDDEARRDGERERPRGDNPPPRREGDRPPLFERRPFDGGPPPRRDGERGGPPRPGFPPPMVERDRELIEVIRQLQREVAELRREVAQLRGGPRPAPRDGELRKDAPRDGEIRKEGPRDGEVRKDAPRDGEIRKEGPRDGEVRKDAPRDGEIRKEGLRDGEVRKDAPRDGEIRKEGPRDGEARKDAPRDGEIRREPAKPDRQ
jgi:beta-lactamase regulating signal transducer with metallopeptidase domain